MAIRKELEKLEKKESKLKTKIKRTIVQTPQDPGAGFVGFLTHILKVVKDIGDATEDASLWLDAWNQRESKKGAFWNKFLNKKRGGSQYLLSSEHYSSRSAG